MTLYLDCSMGASGDMLMAALLELLPDPAPFLEQMNCLGLEGVSVSAEKKETCGIVGTHMHVLVHGQEEGSPDGHDHHHEHAHGHTHSSLHGITHVIRDHLALPEPVKQNALAVFSLIAQAEAHVHGKELEEIHFHEVGTLDAVADVVGVCLLMHLLDVDAVYASPVHVGSGHVHCAHGILPVPAPATAYLLQGIPSYGGEIDGELCTPTGAALLKHFVTAFGPQPVMAAEKIGYGVGSKEFLRANCLRAMLGSTGSATHEILYELSCNIDDMTAEDVAFGMDLLRQAGALEVYTVASNMKKGRPGVILSCLCREPQRMELLSLMFRHFSTLGIRENQISRYALQREVHPAQTPYGPVRVKTASGFGVEKQKFEFEDLRSIAEKTGKSLSQLRSELRESKEG